jgi:hypothetical protein
MTNDQMLALVLNRTRAFFQRVYKPFDLATDTELKRIETQIKKSFAAAMSPPELAFAFLSNVEQAETNIVQHRKIPDKFKYEIESVLNTVVDENKIKKTIKELKALSLDRNQEG